MKKQHLIKSASHATPKRFLVGLALAAALGGYATAHAADDRPARGDKAFAMLDSDSDGTITLAEFGALEAKRMERMDSDANGVVTLDEFLNALPSRGPRRESHELTAEQQARLEARAEKQAERRATMQQRAEKHFATIDSNGDDMLSVEEFVEARFLELDADNNGALTQEELRAQADRGPGWAGRKGGKDGERRGGNR